MGNDPLASCGITKDRPCRRDGPPQQFGRGRNARRLRFIQMELVSAFCRCAQCFFQVWLRVAGNQCCSVDALSKDNGKASANALQPRIRTRKELTVLSPWT